MTWTWNQATGVLSREGKTYAGYSGAGRGKNNPAMQAARNVGPIPCGKWTITDQHDSPNTGPFTLTLEPCEGTDTCGRGDFRIHGDSIAHSGTASHGCIILPHIVRNTIWASGDRNLEVVA